MLFCNSSLSSAKDEVGILIQILQRPCLYCPELSLFLLSWLLPRVCPEDVTEVYNNTALIMCCKNFPGDSSERGSILSIELLLNLPFVIGIADIVSTGQVAKLFFSDIGYMLFHDFSSDAFCCSGTTRQTFVSIIILVP